MSLIEEISNKLNSTKSVGTSFDFSIGTKQFSQDKATRTYLSFFNNEQDNENKNERKWTIEISVSLINTAWKNGELDSSLFLKNCTDALLKNFHIYNLSGNIPKNYCVEDYKPISIPDNISHIFNKYKDLFNSEFRNSNTIIFNDEPKSGKTTFIKYYCNKLRAENVQSPPEIWKLDFSNGHDTIILDFMMSLYSRNLKASKNYLIIDNLECCGYTKGMNIADFFIDLVNILKSREIFIKMIIVQDGNKKCYEGYSDTNKKVHVIDNKIGLEIKNSQFEEELINIHYNKIAEDIYKLFGSTEVDIKVKKRFIDIVFFAKYGVNIKINQNNAAHKEEIFTIEKFVRGIKLMSNGEIISFSVSVCEKVLQQFGDAFKEALSEVETDLIDNDGNFNANVLKCYYTYITNNGLPLSITDFHTILKTTGKRNDNITNYLTILNKAEAANRFITNSVLDESRSDKARVFDYHLGAILFAGETLATYASQNWDTLKAWIKLHNHIKKTFYIDGQEIYICHGREQDDNTIHDFKAEFSKPPKNCINNQIKLQDEVLCQCSDEPYTELPESDVENILSYEDSEGLFGFYLSPIQKEQENKNTTDKIDIDKFYRTYILALLFEFEVMAPEEQRDIVRVEKLWNKIKINCSKSDEFNCRYFYPARVPWVTARMALAMSACLQKFGNHDIADEIASFSQDVGEYLVKSSIKFVKDGKTYRFWSSGTGLWNSTLETTIICAFALKEFAYSKFPNIVEEGINFINLFKGKWFNDNMIADGIWAYQTTEFFLSSNVYEKLKAFVSMTENINFTCNDNGKNDKSLGLSHIAKTLIDLVKDFIAVKPDLLNLPDNIREESEEVNSDCQTFQRKSIFDLATEQVKKWVSYNCSENPVALSDDYYNKIIEQFSPDYGDNKEAEDRLLKAQAFLRIVSDEKYKISATKTEEFKKLIQGLAQKIGRGEALEDE